MTVPTPARLSLCMIVKDEAVMLPGFLERVRGLWDELVVVDTGSTDTSVALLEASGARVLHQPWRHDFALARNHSLEAATGEWFYLALRNISRKWNIPIRNWKAALNRFGIEFEDRMPPQ